MRFSRLLVALTRAAASAQVGGPRTRALRGGPPIFLWAARSNTLFLINDVRLGSPTRVAPDAIFSPSMLFLVDWQDAFVWH